LYLKFQARLGLIVMDIIDVLLVVISLVAVGGLVLSEKKWFYIAQ